LVSIKKNQIDRVLSSIQQTSHYPIIRTSSTTFFSPEKTFCIITYASIIETDHTCNVTVVIALIIID